MRHIPALIAAVLLPAAPQVCFSAAVSTAALVVAQAQAQAQGAEEVATVAQDITVRIDGATQGSGVLIRRVGNRYSVLTAWHVLKSHIPGEELEITTSDGAKHNYLPDSIEQVNNLDLAYIAFISEKDYSLAQLGDSSLQKAGSKTYTAGYPLASESVPESIFRFVPGMLVANAKTATIRGGYQLLYTNPTFPGMSGGPLLNQKAQVIGIHGLGETDPRLTIKHGIAVKTGINQAIPIGMLDPNYIRMNNESGADYADDYFVLAHNKLFKSNPPDPSDALRLVANIQGQQTNSHLYFLKGVAHDLLNSPKKALYNFNKAISLDDKQSSYYSSRAIAYSRMDDNLSAMKDFNRGHALSPDDHNILANRANLHLVNGNTQLAMKDVSRSLLLSPDNPMALNIKGAILLSAGRATEALLDLGRAIRLQPQFPMAYLNKAKAHRILGQEKSFCISLALAAGQGHPGASQYLQRNDMAWCVSQISELVNQ